MAFEKLDSNHDGMISVEELRGYFEALGHKAKKVCAASRRAIQGAAPQAAPPVRCPAFATTGIKRAGQAGHAAAGGGGGHDMGGGRGL